MFQGKGEFEWAQTASLLAMQVNLNRKKGAPVAKQEQFNPFAKRKTEKKIVLNEQETMAVLKGMAGK